MQNTFDKVHYKKQANEPLLTYMDVAAVIVTRNKPCYLIIDVMQLKQ